METKTKIKSPAHGGSFRLPVLRNSKAVEGDNQLPWVGSYFDIPKPAYQSNEGATRYMEAEIHILLKDLGVVKYSIQEDSLFGRVEGNKGTPTQIGLGDPQDIAMPLKDLAFKNPDAIAFAVYYNMVNPKTGERKRCMAAPEVSLMIKINKYTWQWVDEAGNKGLTLIPDVVKIRHPHVFC